jgi:dTDP-4-dehydrorhamnose reductase
MRVLVTGASGLLGYDVVNELLRRGAVCAGCARSVSFPVLQTQLGSGLYTYFPLDLTAPGAPELLFREFRPDAVIHCAAWRDAVSAELPENRAAVFSANEDATRRLARLCNETGAKMICVSTDYVFNGSGAFPRQPDALPDPLNVYGLTKLAGERAVAEETRSFFIVRTQWLFGAHGKSFVSTMLRLAGLRDALSVVDDQIGTPTYTKDLAVLLADMAASEAYGVYHAVNGGGYVSRYGFAEEIFRQAELRVELQPVHTADFPGDPVPRPLNGRLDCACLGRNGFRPLPVWRDALARCLKETD